MESLQARKMKKYLMIILFVLGLVPFVHSQDDKTDTVEIRLLEKENDTAVNGDLSPMRDYFEHNNGNTYKHLRSYQTALYHYMGRVNNDINKRFDRNKENVVKGVVYITKYKTKKRPIAFLVDNKRGGVGTILKR